MPRRPDTSQLTQWLISRSLITRAVAGSLVLALLVTGTFVLLLVAVSSLRASTSIQTQSRDVTSSTLRLEQVVNQLEASLRGFVISGDERFLGSWRQAQGHVPSTTRQLTEELSHQPEQRRLAEQLTALVTAYVDEYGLPLIQIFHRDPSAARAPVATREGLRRVTGIRTGLERLLAVEAAFAANDASSARDQSTEAVAIAVAALCGAALLLILFGLFVVRGITGPVRTVASGASRVAAGDLSTRMPERGAAEILALTAAFNEMARSLERGKRALEVQNEELRQSERMKSQLVSIVSHELRNPLTSILGYTSLLLQREFDPERLKHYLEIIQQQGNRLASMIDHFLDSESVETGRVEIDVQPLDLKPLLVAEANLVADKSEKHMLDVVITPGTLPVKGDRERLAQVIANLLGNAVKYSPGGGVIEVEGEVADQVVRIHVRDDGIGVPDEHQSRIFTRFFRGNARESGISGTGLGLAVSREIVEAHGGRISFTSRAGDGSHFWFELPLDVGAPSTEPSDPASLPATLGEQVQAAQRATR